MSSPPPSIRPSPPPDVESVVANEPEEPAVAPGSRFPADTTDQLMKLADLWDLGVLSSDEFATEKAKLLA